MTSYYHQDALGSTRGGHGFRRAIAWASQYKPFGAEYGTSASGDSKLRFTGQWKAAAILRAQEEGVVGPRHAMRAGPASPPQQPEGQKQNKGGGDVFAMQALRKRGDPRVVLDVVRAMPPDEELAASIDKVDKAHRKEFRMG